MRIFKAKITNFKCYKETFEIELHDGINIIVGNNEAGKSTILEAIHLALTGILNGKYLKNELSQYLFNIEAVNEYLQSVTEGSPKDLPRIQIELFFDGENLEDLQGTNNSEKADCPGLKYCIEFNEEYRAEYEALLNTKKLNSLPIEYYDINWYSYKWNYLTSRSIPLKSNLIDSSNIKFQNGSDMYVSRIIRENLDESDSVSISQAFRTMKDEFMNNPAIKSINSSIQKSSKISKKEIEIAVDLSTRNAWESSLITYLNKIPFHQIGKGEQCIIKTKLALSHKKALHSGLILLEEPENHLSHSKLNELLKDINDDFEGKQIIVSTHSSFVANKLNLKNLILLKGRNKIYFRGLDDDLADFFEKLSGYDTLRLLLCNRSILVEGDSDELVVQKAYMVSNHGRLPIEDGIEIISVGTAFLRFLEIATELNQKVNVVTDSDGDLEAINEKYNQYLDGNKKENISINVDKEIDSGDLEINGKPYNYNTLEPKILKYNGLEKMNIILGKSFSKDEEILKWMKVNKTETALRIFNTTEEIVFPPYILESIS